MLPGLPTAQAHIRELADFAELLSWKKGKASKSEILAYLGQVDDNENNVGCNDDEDSSSDRLDEVMIEIDRRQKACGEKYPFVLDTGGTVLRHRANSDRPRRPAPPARRSPRPRRGMAEATHDLYHYLLLSTRLNMKENRFHADLDGTMLFEFLVASALNHYLGKERSHAMVFGTAAGKIFQDQVDALCRELREGGGFKSLDAGRVQAKDGGLDVVAWVPFRDGLPGQIMVFAQCKTGSNWEGSVTHLQPSDFIKKWISDPFLVDPVRVFCVAMAYEQSHWKSVCVDAGILLDRCRIVESIETLDRGLLSKVRSWTKAAFRTVNV